MMLAIPLVLVLLLTVCFVACDRVKSPDWVRQYSPLLDLFNAAVWPAMWIWSGDWYHLLLGVPFLIAVIAYRPERPHFSNVVA